MTKVTKPAAVTRKAQANPNNVNKIKEAFLKAEAAKAKRAEEEQKKKAAEAVKTEQTQAEEPVVEAPVENSALNIVVPNGAHMFETLNGPVAIFNTGLVSQKLVDIMLYVLNDPQGTFVPLVKNTRQGHGMHTIDFRADGTVGILEKGKLKPTSWYYWMLARMAGCNIQKCVQNAFELAIGEDAGDGEMYLNINTAVWQQILAGFLHELHHAQTAIDSTNELLTNKNFNANEECNAENFAREAMYELAKQVDVEPAIGHFIEDMVVRAWTELDLDNSKDPKVMEFVKCQEYMAKTGDCYVVLTKDMTTKHFIVSSFREFLHLASGQGTEDKAWTNPVPQAAEANPMAIPAANMTQVPAPNNGINYDGSGEYFEEENVDWEDEPVEYESAYQPTNPPGFQGVQQPGGYQPPPQYQQPQPQYQGDPNAIAANAPNNGGYGGYQQPAQQQSYANHSATVGAATYERPNMDPARIQQVINGLYGKIYDRIFNACQFQFTGEGQPCFHAINNIKMQIPLTPEEDMLVKEMDCYVMVNGQEKLELDVPVNGWISGRFMNTDGTLPGFTLALTDEHGNRLLRKFIPQNPSKRNQQGAFTGPAQRAQRGERIAWIIDGMDKDAPFSRRFHDGAFEMKEGNYWNAKQLIVAPGQQKTAQEAATIQRMTTGR